jgi:phenylacetate-CoA ligase
LVHGLSSGADRGRFQIRRARWVTGEFRIALDEPPPRVVPPLKLRIERGVETPKSAVAELEKEIVKALKERLKFSPAIIWLEPNHLERSTHKTRFIEVAPKGA